MRARVVYDPAEPVVIRTYEWEGLAMVDKAVLEGAGIPAMVHPTGGGEVARRGLLAVRREHAADALEILSDQTPADEPDAIE
jgi:hypothetical protein